MTIIKGLQCGINGCKTSKLKRHTHTYGDMRNFGDRALIEQYRAFAQMRGEAFSIPGGDASDMSHYMTRQVKAWDKEAKAFRARIAEEYKEMKRKNKNATMADAEKAVKKTWKWKK